MNQNKMCHVEKYTTDINKYMTWMFIHENKM